MAPSRTAPRGAAPAASTAVVPATLDHDELMALLGQTGMLPKGSDSTFRRMSLVSGSLVTDPGQPDEETWPPTKRGPVMVVRIVKPPIYYSSFYLHESEENGAIDARKIGRPDLNGKFVKKYDDPAEQEADEWSNVEVYDDLSRITGRRGSFKGDIQLQIMPESGKFTGDEPIYTLSLSTTSALDFRGTTKNPEGGVAQEKNFIIQLAELAASQAAETGADRAGVAQAVLQAMTSLKLGGVVAEVYLTLQSNEDKSRTWTVVSFRPIHIEQITGEDAPALPEGDPVAVGPETNSDDIPF